MSLKKGGHHNWSRTSQTKRYQREPEIKIDQRPTSEVSCNGMGKTAECIDKFRVVRCTCPTLEHAIVFLWQRGGS